MKDVSAETALELIFELFKDNPWLTKPGIMRPEDASAEQEALAFLLAGDLSCQWSGCSPSAQRVAHSLLLDFMRKLGTAEGAITRSSWQVDERDRKSEQALSVVASEIRRANPHLGLRH